MRIITVAVIAWLGVATAFIPSQIPRRNALGVSPAYPKAVAPVRTGGSGENIPPFSLPLLPCHILHVFPLWLLPLMFS
jgi:hypothetical protein